MFVLYALKRPLQILAGGGGARWTDPLSSYPLEPPERSGLFIFAVFSIMFFHFQSVSPFFRGMLMFFTIFPWFSGTIWCVGLCLYFLLTFRKGECRANRPMNRRPAMAACWGVQTTHSVKPYLSPPDNWVYIALPFAFAPCGVQMFSHNGPHGLNSGSLRSNIPVPYGPVSN